MCLLSSCCELAVAQIKLAPEYANGQPVVAEVAFPDAPEGSKPHLLWSIGSDAGMLPGSTNTVYIWPRYGPADSYLEIRCTGFLTTTNASGEEVLVKDSHHEFKATARVLAIVPPGPGPGPGPKPDPDPVPVPDGLAPITEPGFRVLIVYESKDLSKLPAAQQAILFDQDVRAYLTAKCVKGADGKTSEWRMVDPNVVVAPDSVVWAKALARERKALPWLIVSDGKRGFEGPLPANKADAMKIIKSIGGE